MGRWSWRTGEYPHQSLSSGQATQGFTDGSGSSFIDKVVNFIGVGLSLYIIAQLYGWASNDSVIKHTVKCKYCRKQISEKVKLSLPHHIYEEC